MSIQAQCPKCGNPFDPGALGGICPACLMREGADSSWIDLATKSRESPSPAGARFVPPRPAELQPFFPQLELQRLLGHGGMGAVYLARQKSLDRSVALKIIRPESAAVPAFADRFAREARALARLNHPNIVGVHDFGSVALKPDADDSSSPRLFYLLMEFVDGANLRQLIADKNLSPREALAIVPQICEALQFAHDQQVVHRDIKPENILLDQRGRVKIADFGLAKLMQTDSDDHSLTGTHQIMGTPRYMAPEQLEQSRSIDHRADIYSLGVVFYEMLTGELPIGVFEPPSRKVQVDVRLDQVVLRSLAKEPDRRYQQASEFKTDVEAASSNSENPAESTRGNSDTGVAIHSLDSHQPESIGRVSRFFSHLDGWVVLTCFLGILSILLPFKMLTVQRLSPMLQMAIRGFDSLNAQILAIAFSLLAVLIIVDGLGKPKTAFWRSIATILVGLLLVGLDWTNIIPPIDEFNNRSPYDQVELAHFLDRAEEFGVHESPRIGGVLAILASMILMLLGSIQLISNLQRMKVMSDLVNSQASLDSVVSRPANALAILGWLALPALLLTLLFLFLIVASGDAAGF